VRDLFHLRDRQAAAVSSTDQGTDAGTRNHANGDALFLENFQDADMGDAAGKTAAEGKSDGGSGLRPDRRWLAGEFFPKDPDGPDDLPQTSHSAATPTSPATSAGIADPTATR